MTDLPLWIPLAVAGIGAVTVASTGFATHWMTRRRDDVRWDRERAERRAQWHREDEARWPADRRGAYTDLLTALHEYGTLRAARRGVHHPDAANRARLRDLESAAERAAQAVLLMAPPGVAAAAGAALGTPRRDEVAVTTPAMADLYAAMRTDLGIAAELG